MKFGGSSLSDTGRIKKVADIILEKSKTHKPVVVVSAMGKTTDNLLKMAYSIAKRPPPREIDMLLTAGERISMALLSMALQSKGLKAKSFTGSQVGIITENRFNRARVLEVKMLRIKEAMDENIIPVVAGFQGVSVQKEITTLGRGGSDLTAIALAISFDNARCEIYTDVDGVYSLDPHKFPGARRYDKVSFEILSELSFSGAKVMHTRAVNLAAKYNLQFWIFSSFNHKKGGTAVGKYLESPGVKGIATRRVVMFDVEGMEGRSVLAEVLKHINLINYSHDSTGEHLVFTIDENDRNSMIEVLGNINVRFSIRDNLMMINIVGWGVGASTEILDTVFGVISEEHVFGVSISDMRISFIVESERAEHLVKTLAEKFNLLENG